MNSWRTAWINPALRRRKSLRAAESDGDHARHGTMRFSVRFVRLNEDKCARLVFVFVFSANSRPVAFQVIDKFVTGVLVCGDGPGRFVVADPDILHFDHDRFSLTYQKKYNTASPDCQYRFL